MKTRSLLRLSFSPLVIALITAASSSCSSNSASPNNAVASGGSAGLSAGGGGGATGITAGTGGSGGTAVGMSGSGGTAVGGTGGTPVITGGTGGTPAMGGGGSGGVPAMGGGGGTAGGAGGASGGSGGAAGGAGGMSNIAPMCATPAVQDGVDRANNNHIECDVQEQAIDFDVAANFGQYAPGYDPATTPVSITDYGTAITGFAVQDCHPYCYKSNLTVGLDLIAGADTSLRGEILFDFPATVKPITDAPGRLSLGWIFVDGPPLPAGTTLTATMVLKSSDKGILVPTNSKMVTPGTWVEFKYFPIEDQGFFTVADLTNITSIGFRVSLGPTAMAADWHGVIYADHFQLRK